MAKYKTYTQHQMMLLPPSLEEKIPLKHLSRVISQVVDELDIAEIEHSYSELGCRAYHPWMLLKILIYGYSIGIRSSRRLQRETREDLVFMWLAGMQEPDFRTISDFRKDRIKDIKKLFRQVLETCAALGMIKCGWISLDGTKIEANSSKHKVTYRKVLNKRKRRYEEDIEEILQEAERIDAEEDRLYGEHDGYSLDKEYSIAEISRALKKIQKKREKLERKTEKAMEKLEVIEGKLEKMGDKRNSFSNTDEDATLMMMKEGHSRPGYNVQFATENQVIVGYGIYKHPNDIHLLEPMIEEAERNLGQMPEAVVADKGYGSHANYEYLEKKGVKAAIPHQHYDYDRMARKRGAYKCSKNIPYEILKLQMMDFLETDEGKALLQRRHSDIEPTIGNIKHNMGFRRFLLRTKLKADIEMGLITIAHNIKKVKTFVERRELAPNLA